MYVYYLRSLYTIYKTYITYVYLFSFDKILSVENLKIEIHFLPRFLSMSCCVIEYVLKIAFYNSFYIVFGLFICWMLNNYVYIFSELIDNASINCHEAGKMAMDSI